MLVCDSLSFGYGKKPVVTQFSCRIGAGEWIALLGQNGSGKTTLLKGLACLLPPLTGTLSLDGLDLFSLSPKKRAHLLASVPQRPHLPSDMSVRDFVFLGRFAHLGLFGLASRRDHEAVTLALEKTNTLHFSQRPLHSLSGGEMQRVLLALTLAQEARFLLLDEISSAVDLKGQIMLFDLLHTLTEAGQTVVCATHDQNLARAYATRILGIRDGRLLFDCDAATACSKENLTRLNGLPMETLPFGKEPRFSYPAKLLRLQRGKECPLPQNCAKKD